MIKRLFKFLFLAGLLFVVGSVCWVGLYRFINPPTTFTMLTDPRGSTHEWRPLREISPTVPRAAIAAEDARFCEHHGFDETAIEAAWRANQSGKRIRGGSTISQQTAKNVFLWQNGGYVRKAIEAWFTFLIEQLWGKRRIMEVYLNVAETGIGTYGVEAGAQRYFHRDASALTALQAARIAAVLPLPKKREAVDPEGFTRRYSGSIMARMRLVGNNGLDRCVR